MLPQIGLLKVKTQPLLITVLDSLLQSVKFDGNQLMPIRAKSPAHSLILKGRFLRILNNPRILRDESSALHFVSHLVVNVHGLFIGILGQFCRGQTQLVIGP